MRDDNRLAQCARLDGAAGSAERSLTAMARRKRGNNLERWEIALVKAMLARGGYNDQDILAYFTRPARSINHRVISEIRNEVKHKSVRSATEEDLDDFLVTWPNVDHETG
jgi:hypothetical protein